MNVGDYVRTEISSLNLQRICKIEEIISDNFIHTDIGTYDIDYVIKSSPNIIDLIEVGDYVNGMEVTRIGGTRWDENDLHCYCEHNGNENWKQVMIPAKDIKSIVTKEQFESMEYKVKEVNND